MEWRFGPHCWHFGRGEPVRIMGIVNVTPDSFSDGGRYAGADAAIAHARALSLAGADIVDVGGESTRPGAEPVAADEECARVVPVVSALRDATVPVSIDTSKAAVAHAALSAGACIVNDVTALGDASMAAVVAEARAGLVLMHMRGTPATMQLGDLATHDIVGDVVEFLERRLAFAVGAGIDADRVALDPGICFGKTLEQNLALLRGLPRLAALGRPLVLGVSRKSFLGALTGRPVEGRDAATTAAHALLAAAGAHVLRVHDVAATSDALRVARALAPNGVWGAA
ncbi:dihydropteroate synthase [Myxococcota bacterium]|nr:dihydropteroate synthase [Myxococcota bacterium]